MLGQLGLPEQERLLGLLSFNVGIELGQLLFVGCVLALQLGLAPWLRRLPNPLELLPAYGIGSLAVYWCLERVVGGGGG